MVVCVVDYDCLVVVFELVEVVVVVVDGFCGLVDVGDGIVIDCGILCR